MFWNRWHLAWLGVCFLVAAAGAFFMLFMLIVEGLPRPSYTPLDLMGFLLAFYTLPVVALYLGGLVVGWTMRRIYRRFTRPSRPRAAWPMGRMAAVKR
jgi:hypothetical protein